MAIGTSHRLVRPPRPGAEADTGRAAAGAPHMTEDLVEDVFRAARPFEAEVAATGSRTGPVRAATRAIGPATEAAGPRLAPGIDPAAAELAALVGIAEYIVVGGYSLQTMSRRHALMISGGC